MRPCLFVLLILGLITPKIGFSQSAAGAWFLLPNSPEAGSRHDDVFFVNADVGWVVNLSGDIFKTTDGGDTWTQQYEAVTASGNNVGLRSTGFANEQLGWAGSLTRNYLLYETRDGGQTWTHISNRISGPAPHGICGLWVVNENIIYGVGRYDGPARLIKSTDGGRTWTSRDMSAYAGTLVDVYFFNSLQGVAVGGSDSNLRNARAVVLTTDDGGNSWTRRHVSTDLGEWGWKISFPTPLIGYVSVERFQGAKVLKTINGGLSWNELRIPGSNPLQGLAFVNEDIGWTSGRGTPSQTTDGGLTWDTALLGGNINRFRMLGDTLGYAVGERVYKYVGSSVTHTEAHPGFPVAFKLLPNYPNPFTPHTTLAYTIDRPVHVRLTIYDMLGRPVQTLVDAHQGAGRHEVTWHGTDEAGLAVPAGLYLYRLDAGGLHRSQTMLLIR